MRVLIVTDWPALEAGTERTVERLREGLSSAGDDVRLLTSSAGSAADGSAEYVAYGTDRPTQQALLQLFNPSAYRTIRRAVDEFRPDAVHLNMFLPHLSPAVLHPLAKVPTVIVVHDYKPICPRSTKLLPDGTPCTYPAGRACTENGCVGPIRRLREGPRYSSFRRGLRSANGFATISRWMRGQLSINGIEAEVIHAPVPDPGAGYVRRPAREPVFLYAGRLAPVKGLDVLLDAFAKVGRRVPDARLRIVGDGPLRGAVSRRTRELGLEQSVSFEFSMERDWYRELEGAWAVVVPSTYREPLGLVAAEAIAHGVPVIASGEGGLAETVTPGKTGVLVPSRDRDALADAMEEIARRRSFPERSVDPVAQGEIRRRHDPDRAVSRTRSLLTRACQEARPA
jgi:glycosyltransferase involved in cell wall biosynthesis